MPEPLVRARGRATAVLFRTVGAVVVLAAAVAGVVAWRHSGAERPRVAVAEAAPAVVQVRPHTAAAHHGRKAARPPAAARRQIFTVIRARRDRSWLSIRIGGSNGREVFRGTLERGHALRYGLARPVWMRMGRPHALDITIGKALVGNLPHDPSNLLLTRSGPRR